MRPGCDADNRKAAAAFPWVGKSRLAAYVGVRQALARGSVALSAHAVGGSAARARGARTFLLGDGGLALGAVVAAGGFHHGRAIAESAAADIICAPGFGLAEAIEGADVFIGVSRPGCLTAEMCRHMAQDAIVFAMANPTPEIMPDEAKAGGVRIIATGRSDFANQVNNVLCFPGLFKGALSVRARDINDAMKLAAAYAIADLIGDDERSEEYIIPGAFDPRVAESVAAAVAKAARETGVARL